MSALRIASKIEIVPSMLGETEFIGPGFFARAIEVDMSAGTITVAARDVGEGDPIAFDWQVPLVPLSVLTPLVEQLIPYLERALAGTSIREAGADARPIVLTPTAQRELEAADELVFAFYRRRTGRPYWALRAAQCATCDGRLPHGADLHGRRWFESVPERDRHGAGSRHKPQPIGHPYALHHAAEGHELDLDYDEPGGWAGTCACGTWTGADPADREPVMAAHHLHVEAIPAGAPFDI